MVGRGATNKIVKSQCYNSMHWIKFKVSISCFNRTGMTSYRETSKNPKVAYIFLTGKSLLSGPRKIQNSYKEFWTWVCWMRNTRSSRERFAWDILGGRIICTTNNKWKKPHLSRPVQRICIFMCIHLNGRQTDPIYTLVKVWYRYKHPLKKNKAK